MVPWALHHARCEQILSPEVSNESGSNPSYGSLATLEYAPIALAYWLVWVFSGS